MSFDKKLAETVYNYGLNNNLESLDQIPDGYDKYYLRGFIKNSKHKTHLDVTVFFKLHMRCVNEFILPICERIGIYFFLYMNTVIIYSRENMIEFLTYLKDEEYNDDEFYQLYSSIMNDYNRYQEQIPTLTYSITIDGAKPPQKNTINDAGYDLHLTKFIKQVNNVYLFDTGVKIIPPIGFYTEVVPRSSIYKLGYTLSNNVGIIDSNYRGNIMVALLRDEKSIDPEELVGQKMVQVILKKMFVSKLLEIEPDSDQWITTRGTDGGINRS